MFEAYVDESGTEESWCAVAGFIGLASDWRVFETEWTEALKAAGAVYFHATKFFAARGPFGGWSEQKRKALIDRLTALITERGRLKLIAAAVDTNAFFSRTEHERVYLTGGRWANDKWTFPGAPSRPYYVPLCNILDRCYRQRECLDLFHDSHNVYAKHVQRLHAQMTRYRLPASVRQGIGAITFGAKRDYVPLQAADLAAYLTFRRVTHGQQPRDSLVGRASKAFERFGQSIVAYDAPSIDSHLRASLPKAIRDGLMPSQLRATRRREVGQTARRSGRGREPRNGTPEAG